MTNASLLIVPDRFKASKLYSQLPQDGSGDFVVTRATTAYRTNENGILESVASGVPRLDFPIGSGCPALLVEPAATNLFLNSVWAGGGTPPTSWATPFLTGTATVATSTLNPSVAAYTFATANQRAVFSQNISQTSGVVYTHSIYVEAVTSTLTVENLLNYNISIAGISTFREDGVAVLATHVVQSGKRYSLTITAPSTASNQVRIGNGVSSNTTATVRLSSPQIETGSVATSFINTTAATATRNADVISKTAVSGLIGQTEGTLYAEVSASIFNSSLIHRILTISDGTTNNRIGITRVVLQNNRFQGIAANSGSLTVQIQQTADVTANSVVKLALAYALNDYAFYVNGVLVGVNTSSAVPACSRIDIGNQLGSDQFGSGLIRAAALYTTRLSNAQLQFLTTL
jgi:hypothetical protein